MPVGLREGRNFSVVLQEEVKLHRIAGCYPATGCVVYVWHSPATLPRILKQPGDGGTCVAGEVFHEAGTTSNISGER